jgi:predicted RecA/RadA family phage recombinase
MASNYQQPGEVIQWTNATGSAVAANAIVVVGHMVGIALQSIANGASGSVGVEGVYSGVPKVSAAVFAQGEKLILDVSAGAFDDSSATPSTGDLTGAAVAWVAGANTETSCTIKLTPGNVTRT